MCRPSKCLCRVFEHTAESTHTAQRRRKTAAVIARPVVLAAPSGKIDRSHCAPPLARRVRNDWKWPVIKSCIPALGPRVNVVKVRIAPVRLYKKRSNLHRRASMDM